MCFPGGSVVNESACSTGDAGDLDSIPGQEDPLEKGMAVFSPGESPRTEKPGGLQPIGPQRIRQD